MHPASFPLILTLALTGAGRANDAWPDFRGPHQNGHCDATGLPLRWSEDQNVTWKTAIHGRAWSSPVVLGNQVWLNTATPKKKSIH